MIAFVVRLGCGFLALVILVSVLGCAFLAQLYVPAGAPVLGGIAPDARLVVTAQRAPVYAEPDGMARVVGSLSVDTQGRAAGPDTAEWVRVRSIDPVLSGWVRRADIEELRRYADDGVLCTRVLDGVRAALRRAAGSSYGSGGQYGAHVSHLEPVVGSVFYGVAIE